MIPTRVGFCLLPGCSALVYAAASETLLACNRLSGEVRYQLEHYTVSQADGTPACAFSAGLPIAAAPLPETAAELPDWLLVCGGTPARYQSPAALLAWLSQFGRRLKALGGLATGGMALAEAGLLDGYRAALHWWSDPELARRFPQVRLAGDVFAVDRDRFSCRGGSAAQDLLTLVVGREQGAEVSKALAELAIRERVGEPAAPARAALSPELTAAQPALAETVSLMMANIEEPLTAEDLAQHVGISRRQLERLFRRYLDTVPSRHYLQIRLERARDLVRTSGAPITEVALQCGFSSGAHFSTSYRNFFGLTPSEDRENRG
jgi:transcriptional regulator GlxA family with amidase domain